MLDRRVFTILFLFFLSCSPIGEYGLGRVNDVILVFDGAEREAKFLKEFLEEVYNTPHPEKIFNVYPLRMEQFEGFRGYKNVILISTYSSPVYRLFYEVFRDRGSGIHVAKNGFDEGDYVIGILAEDEPLLFNLLKREKNRIKNLLIDRLKELLREKAYFTGHDKSLRKEVLKKYGFTFDFPEGWAYAVEEKNFVCFAKHYPDRFFFVYFEDTPRTLEPDRLMDLRDELTERYYEGDFIDRNFSRVEEIEFLGVPALKVMGVWQNDKYIRGGPFEFIAFNYKNRFYMIDLGVFLPEKRRKLEYILRLEIIAESFKISQ
jgi:hypothetical protein